MNVEGLQATANLSPSQTTSAESDCRLPESTPTSAIYYYYWARKLILILPFRGG